MRQYPIQEHEHSINGVPGRMFAIQEPQEVRGSMVHLAQKWVSEGRAVTGYGTNGTMHVNIRFDDECRNGHQSFSITADVYTTESRRQRDIAAGGCLHEDIAIIFPELIPLIKWHLMGTDGPMYYVANTVYHAGNRDCNGLTAGEVRQIRNGKTGLPCWTLETTPADLPRNVDAEECPTETATVRYVPWTSTGEGKERDLDAARKVALWPEATDEQLCLPAAELTALLEARLPGLMLEFRAAMDAAGLLWEPSLQRGAL